MSYLPPPPSPQNDPYSQQPQGGLFGLDMRKIAQEYTKWKWLISLAGRFGGFKVPKEVDFALETLAHGGQLTPEQEQDLQGYAQQAAGQYGASPYGQPPQNYPQEPPEMPQPAIGEPVLTRDLAFLAWQMKRDGMSLREIAEDFTRHGNPCSYATVAKYVNAVDEEIRTSKALKIRKIGKYAFFAGLWLASLIIVYIIF